MEKYNRSENTRQLVKSCVCDKIVTKEMSVDFTLPDYQPEIKRLLRIGAEVLLPESSFGMNDCEFFGMIDYYVMYIGADNQMYCAPLSAEYRISIPIEDSSGLSYDGDANIECEFVNGRVTAKRKISIRSRLVAHASIFNNIPLENEFCDGADPSCARRLDGQTQAAVIERGVSDIVNISDEIIPDRHKGDIRVVCAEGRVFVSESQAQSGTVSCKGDVYVKLLICPDEGEIPYTVTRKLPFSLSMPIENAETGCYVCAKGSVRELTVTVDEGRIELSVGVSVNATVGSNKAVTYTKDMYSTLCHTTCDYFSPEILTVKGGVNTNLSLGETRTLEELKLSPDIALVDVNATAMIDNAEIVDLRAKISGKVKYTLLLHRDGEYTPTEMEFPFVYNAEVKDGTDMVVADAGVISCRGRIDGERMGLDSEIYICLSFFGREKINALTALHFGELVKRDSGKITVYYPTNRDSLWSVGKRYNVSDDKIIDDNKLGIKSHADVRPDSRESLAGAHHIIITH